MGEIHLEGGNEDPDPAAGIPEKCHIQAAKPMCCIQAGLLQFEIFDSPP